MNLKFRTKYDKYYKSDDYSLSLEKGFKMFGEGVKSIREYIPYYNIVFKNDLIQYDNKTYPVYECIITTGSMPCDKQGKELYPDGGHQHLEYKVRITKRGNHISDSTINYSQVFLYKRPWFNWLKFIYVLITKTYIK